MKVLFLVLVFSCSRNPSSLSSKTTSSPKVTTIPWWNSLTHLNQLKPFKSKNIIIGIIDTGIDPKHPIFANRLYTYDDTNNLIPISESSYGFNLTGPKLSFQPMDDVGHGTHVAGIIDNGTKLFPEIKFVIYKYYTNQKNASIISTLTSTIRAIELATKHGVDVINYSAGGVEPSLAEKNAIDKAREKGIIFVTAAGNDGKEIGGSYKYYPGSYNLSNIITVGNTQENLKLHPSSNYSSQYVHIAAPGDRILSTLPFNGFGTMTGTSQAAPFVTAAVAITKLHNNSFPMNSVLEKSSQSESLQDKIVKGSLLNFEKL
jgi:subtilisin family serine protease